jgi:hypothetical protein
MLPYLTVLVMAFVFTERLPSRPRRITACPETCCPARARSGMTNDNTAVPEASAVT